MTFHIPNPFNLFRPKRDETAELRDALIVAETQVLLLRDLVDHPPAARRTRETRKDAASIIAAKAVTTQRLMRMHGKAS